MKPEKQDNKPDWSLGRTLTVVGQRVSEADKKGAALKLLCMAGECVLIALQFNLVFETLLDAGLEMKFRFIELPLIGWLFTFTPELTGMHLLALLAATCFVLTPVILWLNYLNGFSFQLASPAERAGACLFILIFLVTIAVEIWVVKQRVQIGSSNPWNVGSGQSPEVVAAMGIILALMNIAFAFGTACVHHRFRKRG